MRRRGHAQEDSDDDDGDDCMSDAETIPATDAEIMEQLGHEQTRPHPLPAPRAPGLTEEERAAVGRGQTHAD
eukprot:9151500-Pyramimonas_sp.AAC.1